MLKTKNKLDNFVLMYQNADFIKNDPIQFLHKFEDKNDIEIAGFISSIYAYGKREVFIQKLAKIFDKMDNKPYEFVINFDEKSDVLDDCEYRFSKGIDLKQIVLILKTLYTNNESLETLFAFGWNKSHTVNGMLQVVVDYFYSRISLSVTNGFYHLLPNPNKGSACKRLNMFLRWMVRDGSVDLGLWNFMPKSELIIPLDVHVARVSRDIGLLNRQQNDWKSAKELTDKLKEFCPSDPVKYDFAMFGYGVNN